MILRKLITLAACLQEIKSLNRVFPALSQSEMQQAVRHVLATVDLQSGKHAEQILQPLKLGEPGSWNCDENTLDNWILENLVDGQRRLRLVETLTAAARPFRYSKSHIQQQLGDLYSENVS